MSIWKLGWNDKAKDAVLVKWARSDQEFLPAALAIF